VGGQKERPTLVSFLIFNKLKIFSCLKEINTHFLYLDVSVKSFLRSDFEKRGLISIKRACLLSEALSRSFNRGIGLPSLCLFLLS
jgi:hypothetical protein